MSVWYGASRFDRGRFGRAFDVQLGKMLQPESSSAEDVHYPYLKASSLSSGEAVLGEDRMWIAPSDLARYEVRKGDLLVVEGGDVGRSALYGGPPAIIQNSLHRVRGTSIGDVRFAAYCLELLRNSSYLEVLCNVATIRHLTVEKLRDLAIPLPGLQAQAAIADFLDAKTSELHALSMARRSQAQLLSEADAQLMGEALAERGVTLPDSLDGPVTGLPVGWRLGELGHVLRQLTNGYVGPTRDILQDQGVRYIQSLHVKEGQIDFSRRPYYVSEAWHSERPRIHLLPGDVLIVQTGDIGQVAVVPDDFGPASCHALQIARVEPGVMSGAYLGEFLRSGYGRAQLLARATGALHPHLESGIKSTPVLVPPLHEQLAIVRAIEARRAELTQLRRHVDRSLQVINEYRRSLVEAAVLGHLVIPAAGRIGA